MPEETKKAAPKKTGRKKPANVEEAIDQILEDDPQKVADVIRSLLEARSGDRK